MPSRSRANGSLAIGPNVRTVPHVSAAAYSMALDELCYPSACIHAHTQTAAATCLRGGDLDEAIHRLAAHLDPVREQS